MADTYAAVSEFVPRAEAVTAQIDVRLSTGESFTGPIAVGYYSQHDDITELWIEQDGRRVQFPADVLQAVVKQMRRAAQIAKEDSNG